ncbi:glycosyltransferase family 2 protein [Cohnella hongkongensis]|uniref:Glycosyltransferase family 2 protein n=1 Tax=Cohnella hongkongensis TaxID=178337 RepID=A0ABV9FG08_9BACL
MKISVVIPTLNAASYIRELIDRLKHQSMDCHEIIIVDSMSNDQTVEIAQRLGVTVLSVPRDAFDHGGTRNYAASHAEGDVLVFITQDALPEKLSFLEELTTPLAHGHVVAVYGRQIARPGASPIERMTREFNYHTTPMIKSLADVGEYGIKTFFFTNVCSAIRKDIFQEMGGFQEPIISNEDMIFTAKALLKGYSVAYAPKATVLHSHHYSLRMEFRRNFDLGVSFRMNDWIFEYATPEGEGFKLIKAQIRYLCKHGLWIWLPRWFAESVAKYLGYRLGLSFRKIPRKIVRKFSMHRLFWRV